MRTPRPGPAALAIAALALLPAGASGATVGSATPVGGEAPGPGPNTYVQSADGPGLPSYAIPAGGGVVTAWKARLAGAAGTAKLKIVRPASGVQWSAVGESPGAFAGSGAFTDASFNDARIPVRAGDRLGIFLPTSVGVSAETTAIGSALTTFAGDLTGTASPSGSLVPNARLNLQATVEPDADGDGYGDTTQDACPALADNHTGPCATDLAVTAVAQPAALAAGAVTTVVVTATAGPGPATGATGTIVLPAGVQVIAASTTGGECSGAGPLTCDFGDVPAGGARKAFLVLRPTVPGAATIVATVQSGTPDSAPANNTLTTTLSVGAPTGASSVSLCKVPKLAGLSASAAGKRLKSAGCKLGRAGGAKGKGARVRSQAIPAGIKVAAGTKVAVTLGLPKTKAKAKRR